MEEVQYNTRYSYTMHILLFGSELVLVWIILLSVRKIDVDISFNNQQSLIVRNTS